MGTHIHHSHVCTHRRILAVVEDDGLARFEGDAEVAGHLGSLADALLAVVLHPAADDPVGPRLGLAVRREVCCSLGSCVRGSQDHVDLDGASGHM